MLYRYSISGAGAGASSKFVPGGNFFATLRSITTKCRFFCYRQKLLALLKGNIYIYGSAADPGCFYPGSGSENLFILDPGSYVICKRVW
jgi:hypothetical protein